MFQPLIGLIDLGIVAQTTQAATAPAGVTGATLVPSPAGVNGAPAGPAGVTGTLTNQEFHEGP